MKKRASSALLAEEKKLGRIISVERFISPLVMWIIVFAGILFAFSIFGGRRIIPPNMFTPFLFIPALLYWLFFFFGAASVHREAPRSVASIARVIRTGVYGKVRHPMYSADIVLVWGVFFVWPTFEILLSVLWMTTILVVWMFLEEYGLRRRFGKEYQKYAKDIPMIFPRF
jgi:protein-S-isoprenylcysteine O-methyltransferase Ste14